MYGVDPDGDPADDCKWYEHDTAVCAMSAEFPNTVFRLHGEGEESGDLWEHYFHNGKVLHKAKAVVTFSKPDLTKLPVIAPKVKATLPTATGRKFRKDV